MSTIVPLHTTAGGLVPIMGPSFCSAVVALPFPPSSMPARQRFACLHPYKGELVTRPCSLGLLGLPSRVGKDCPSLRAVTLPVSQHFRVCGLHRFAEGAATPQRFGSPTGWDLHPSRKRGQRSRHCAGWFWRRHHVKVQDCRSLPAVTSPGRLPLVSPSARQAWGCPSHMLRQVSVSDILSWGEQTEPACLTVSVFPHGSRNAPAGRTTPSLGRCV